MADTTPVTPVDDSSAEVTLSPYHRMQMRFPRTVRVVSITAGLVGALATVIVANTARKNKSHLTKAADYAGKAVQEVSTSVSPTGTEA